MDSIVFTKNIYLSCKNHSMIREDGKVLTLFNRILDFFRGKHGYDHFLGACKRFSKNSIVEKIKCLPKEEQVEIIARMRQIQKKITHQTSKQTCDLYIKKVEANLLSKNVDEYSDVIFTKILNSAKNKKYKADDHIRNLEEIINFFSNDKESISRISLKFSSFLKETQSASNASTEKQQKFFGLINKKIVNILMPILGTPNLPDQWRGFGRSYSEHQVKLHFQIQSILIEPNLFEVNEESSNQVAIGRVVQSIALPLYKEPMPQTPSYRNDATNVRVELSNKSDDWYKNHVNKVHKQLTPSRSHHGTMHCVRVALWTQLLSKVYEKLGREKTKNPILLATAGAFHDVAREEEGRDYWDTESSEALEKLFSHIKMSEQGQEYTQAIKEKDPKNGKFSSDIQRIVHDADCLDIIRVVGTSNFTKKHLCFYNFDPKQKSFCDQLVNEIGNFITMTEMFDVRNYLEHHSEDFYGDLVRLIFLMQKKDKAKFPIITEMLQHDMEDILNIESTQVTKHLLSILQ